MKWVIIKGVRYPSSVISAFAAYNMDNPFLKVRIRNKYHIVPFDDVNKMASQMVYLMDNYPDFVQIGRWWISKKAVMSWVPKGQTVDGSGWVISFTLSYSRVMFDYGDNCSLTGMCYDYYLLKPIIDYYNAWCTYPEDFSLEDLMRQCYDNFFKSWHEEYEYWADNEDAIREELHHNQYEDRLYYENGDIYEHVN